MNIYKYLLSALLMISLFSACEDPASSKDKETESEQLSSISNLSSAFVPPASETALSSSLLYSSMHISSSEFLFPSSSEFTFSSSSQTVISSSSQVEVIADLSFLFGYACENTQCPQGSQRITLARIDTVDQHSNPTQCELSECVILTNNNADTLLIDPMCNFEVLYNCPDHTQQLNVQLNSSNCPVYECQAMNPSVSSSSSVIIGLSSTTQVCTEQPPTNCGASGYSQTGGWAPGECPTYACNNW